MKYKIKGFSGSRPAVSFRCDHCHDGLVASLEEAGSETVCPTCAATLSVPAENELAEWRLRRSEEVRIEGKKRAEREAGRQRAIQAAQEDARQAQQEALQTQSPASTGTAQSWHVALNAKIAAAVSVLNAVVFCLIIGAGTFVGASSGKGVADDTGLIVGCLLGFLFGLLVAFAYCGLIALLINMSNQLTALARAQANSTRSE